MAFTATAHRILLVAFLVLAPAVASAAPPAPRRVPFVPPPGAAAGPRSLANARICKVFDRNANGVIDAGEALVPDWRIRLATEGKRPATRSTGEDGCVTFGNLAPGTYEVSELPVPFWKGPEGVETKIVVPEEAARSGRRVASPLLVGTCLHFAKLGGAAYWRSPAGLRLLEESDRRFLNGMDPFVEPSGIFTTGDEPFDGLRADGRTPVRAALPGSGAWGAGTWEAEVARFLDDRGVAANPRGRLARELLVFALNSRHFLEQAWVVYVEDVPIYVSDLLFEGVAAWRSGDRRWMGEMTDLLADLNGSRALTYVPRDHCQVAYLPF